MYIEDENVGYDIKYQLKKFENPHREIHSLADEIDTLICRGDYEDAIKRIEHAKNTTLSTMLGLFSDFYKMVLEQHEKDIALVVSYGSKIGAFPVDKIDSIDYLSEITPLSLFSSSKLVSNCGKRNDKTILILNLEAIFN